MSIDTHDYLYELFVANEKLALQNGSESLQLLPQPTMAPPISGPNQNERDLIIKFSGGKYHIWMDTFAQFTHTYIHKFCRFLDTLPEDATVNIYLGAHLEAEVAMDTPSILSAIISSKCKVHAVACGPTSAFETAIYCFADSREFRKYGYLMFTRPSYVKKHYKEWAHINQMIFTKAIELNLLTEDQMNDILTYNNTIIINYDDVVK